MKKLVLTFIMAFTAILGFSQSRFHHFRPLINLDECYELTIDLNRLSDKLQLDESQMEYLEVATDCMHQDIEDAISKKGFRKHGELNKAIAKDIQYMKEVLNEEQFKMYVDLLLTTLHNNVVNAFEKVKINKY